LGLIYDGQSKIFRFLVCEGRGHCNENAVLQNLKCAEFFLLKLIFEKSLTIVDSRNGASLEYLELTRSSLLRMDPLLFRNVLTSASRLHSLVVKNICSDAMLKLIGTHCHGLQYLDISR
jgi:hypothetical protein